MPLHAKSTYLVYLQKKGKMCKSSDYSTLKEERKGDHPQRFFPTKYGLAQL